MGIIKLTFLTVGAMGAAMLHFGRDVDLPADRLGMEPGIQQSTIEPVSAAVKQPILVAPKPAKVIKAVARSKPVVAPDPNSQASRAVAAAKLMAANAAQVTPVVATPAATSGFPTMVVRASAVNMRAGPSTKNGIVGRLTRGNEVVNMGDAAPGWSQIRVVSTGQRGFVASKFLAAQK